MDHATAVEMAEGFVADDSAKLIVMAPVFRDTGGNPMDERYLDQTKALNALQDRLFAENGPSFGTLRARMAEEGFDVDRIIRDNGVALSPDDPVPGR